MPKIPPRESVREHPLYRAAMAAQHAAYQLMRDVPAGSKADATRLHVALVHATTWATAAVDEDVPAAEREAARGYVLTSAESANEMLVPLAPLANDAGIVDTLEKEIEKLLGKEEKREEPRKEEGTAASVAADAPPIAEPAS